MRFDDAQIERYSRQLVLAEIGPHGQARLAAARVAITISGAGAERVVAYLAAAGIGTLALPPALRDRVDPARPDLVLLTPADAALGPFDAALVGAAAPDVGAARARRTFWIADGRAAEAPPCGACATAQLGTARTVPVELATLRDAVLGTVVATEIVKALLEIGTPLREQALTYDPTNATLISTPIAARPGCACRRAPEA